MKAKSLIQHFFVKFVSVAFAAILPLYVWSTPITVLRILQSEGLSKQEAQEITKNNPQLDPVRVQENIQWLKQQGATKIYKIAISAPSSLEQTPEELNAKLLWYRKMGIENFVKVIEKHPPIITMSAEYLNEKTPFLAKNHIDARHVIESLPQILGLSISDNLEPKIEWLKSVGVTNPGQMINRYAIFLGLSLEKNLKPTWYELSYHWGIPAEILEQYPSLLTSSLARLQTLRKLLDQIAGLAGLGKFELPRISLFRRMRMIKSMKPEDLFEQLYRNGILEQRHASINSFTTSDIKRINLLAAKEEFDKLAGAQVLRRSKKGNPNAPLCEEVLE